MNAPVEKINQDLKQHQMDTKDWDYRDIAESLHLWSERFILEFKLQTSVPAIKIEFLYQSRNGHFRYGRNGFGLRNEIAIDKNHLQEAEYWNVLGTLLHEILHSEQQNIGQPGRRNYHNKEFRERARSFGLIVDERGCQQYAPAPSSFLDLLNKYGVDAPKIPVCETLVSKSKQKLWVCKCEPKPVHVRVAVQDFQARCLKCGQLFTSRENQFQDNYSLGYSQKQSKQTNPTGTGFIYTCPKVIRNNKFTKEQKNE